MTGTTATIAARDIWSSAACASTTASTSGAEAMLTRIQLPPVLDAETVPRLHAALDAGTTGVLVLEGADSVFCRGMDLDGLGDERAAESAEAFARCLEVLRFARGPSIAIVDGVALGGCL